MDFADAQAVSQLTGSGSGKLVCLQFPDDVGRLFAHPAVLSVLSGVLRNLLEDVQQPAQGHTTVPLDDTDTAAWRDALGLVYQLPSTKITLDNACSLLMLAQKYDMPGVAARLQEYMMGTDCSPADSRFANHLSPDTVMDWLVTSSRCGLEQQVKMCIKYAVDEDLAVGVDTIIGMEKADAEQLLAAKHARYADYGIQVARAVNAETSYNKVEQELQWTKKTLQEKEEQLQKKTLEMQQKEELLAPINKHHTCSSSSCRTTWLAGQHSQQCPNCGDKYPVVSPGCNTYFAFAFGVPYIE